MLLGILDADPTLTAGRAGWTVIVERHHYGRSFATTLAGDCITLLHLTRAGEVPRPGSRPIQAVAASDQVLTHDQLIGHRCDGWRWRCAR